MADVLTRPMGDQSLNVTGKGATTSLRIGLEGAEMLLIPVGHEGGRATRSGCGSRGWRSS